MGGISLSATMHRCDTNTIVENYDEEQTMELGVSYSLGNNASLGLKYVTDETKNDGSGDASDI